ncbi:hypothetical protein BJ085DRAFT_24277, partial [Dimargaris cristalligena]
ADRFVCALLLGFARAYQAAAHNRCRPAVDHFERLPPTIRASARVMTQLGRLYFELGDYPRAESHFNWAWEHQPYRVEGLEAYSTLLWHTRQLTALSHLAHTLAALHRRTPEAWCAVGNCFSLQCQHAAALGCFERASQLDSQFVYAYTLAGHEHIAYQQDWTQAQQCFRTALRLDPRHYNAWYGLGLTFHQCDQEDLAAFHFTRALELYPHNPTLHCALGMVREKQQDHTAALAHYERAIEAAATHGAGAGPDTSLPSHYHPQAGFARFKRASLLVQAERYHEALADLALLKAAVPHEANIYFLAAQIHQHLNQADQAVLCYGWALDLDPQSAPLITEAMEKLDVDLRTTMLSSRPSTPEPNGLSAEPFF